MILLQLSLIAASRYPAWNRVECAVLKVGDKKPDPPLLSTNFVAMGLHHFRWL